MIKAHPESDLHINIMVLGADIVSILNSKPYKNKFSLVEDILSAFLKKDKKRSADLFIYSLVFLYSVGLIEYNGYKISLASLIEEQPNLFNYDAHKALF